MAGQNIVFSHNSGGRAVIRVTANATINVVANSSVGSDISTANGTVDPVIGANITKLMWSTPNNIKVARGANTLATLNQSGVFDFKSMGISENEFNAANITITITDANSVLYFEVSKLYPGGTL